MDEAAEGSGTRPCLLVSACLLGLNTRYDGGHQRNEAVLALADRYTLVPVCPEQLGGLSTPRTPGEIQPAESDGEGRTVVRSPDGRDLSAEFRRGAAAAVAIAALVGAEGAILKARSPSCGLRETYDGTFTNTMRSGSGVAAAALAGEGLALYTEEDVAAGRGPA